MMKEIPCHLFALLAVLLASLADAAPTHHRQHIISHEPPPLLVRTSRGVVKGHRGVKNNRFVLPYAQPPIGARRFRDPVALGDSSSVYNGEKLPNPCAQSSSVIRSSSEDCLFVSIYTPSTLTNLTEKLPVFVWLHGGSFSTGSSSMSGLDGSDLAVSQSMVVVTVQYRLGMLGFLKNDALGVSGNFGLKDVAMALTYIQQDISYFGGDPTSVTLAGQGSGGEMVKSLLVTPSASTLFHRTIIHSAPLALPDASPSTANFLGGSIARSLGCPTLACLQARPVSALLATQAKLSYFKSPLFAGEVSALRVIVDGTFVARVFGQIVQLGGAPFNKLFPTSAPKPTIFTTVRDEACNEVVKLFPNPVPNTSFDGFVDRTYRDGAASILASRLYAPHAGDVDGFRNSVAVLMGDAKWVCATQQTAVNITLKSQGIPFFSGAASLTPTTYVAQFNSGVSYTNGSVPFCSNKVTNGDDIYALFGRAPSALSAAQLVLSREVADRWGAFAHTGSPNTPRYLRWSPVESHDQLNLLLLGDAADGSSTIAATQRAAQCQVGGLWGSRVLFDVQVGLMLTSPYGMAT